MTASVDISLGHWFAERARRSPRRRALTFEGTTLTYAELHDRIDRLAAAFRAGGVCHGDALRDDVASQPAACDCVGARITRFGESNTALHQSQARTQRAVSRIEAA